MAGARPDHVSDRAKERQRREMGTLGSGNHYLEVQAVAEIFDRGGRRGLRPEPDEVVVTIHCGSRGLGHQIGTEFLKEMVVTADASGIELPDRELACAPINSEVGQRYLGAMRAAINCALANREILGHYCRRVFGHFFPDCDLASAVRCLAQHLQGRAACRSTASGANCSFIARARPAPLGPATRAFPPRLRPIGQPVLIGGSMGTGSYILVGETGSEAQGILVRLPRRRSCDVAPRGAQAMERPQDRRRSRGQGILIRSPSTPRRRRGGARRLQGRGRGRGGRGACWPCPPGGAAAAAHLHQGMTARQAARARWTV